MKIKITFLLLLCFCFSSGFFANKISDDKEDVAPLEFVKVIEVKEGTKSKAELFPLLRTWMSDYYHSSKDVLQYEDKDAGIITGRALFLFEDVPLRYAAYSGTVSYSVKFQMRDNRARVTVSQFVHKNKPTAKGNYSLGGLTTAEDYTDSGINKSFHNRMWKQMKKEAEEHAEKIFESSEKFINENSSVVEETDDW